MRYLFHPVLHAAHLLEEKLRGELIDAQLQPRQARLLDAIARLGPIQQGVLARRLHVSPPSMSVMITRLVRADLVVREAGPSNVKDLFIHLTPKGEALLPAIHAAWQHLDAELFHVLGTENAQNFSQSGLKLRDHFGQSGPHITDTDRTS
jgi:DNA-binding MarR family transcriptional regulator